MFFSLFSCQVQDKLEEKLVDLNPVGTGNVLLAEEVCQQLDRLSYRREVGELIDLLTSQSFQVSLKIKFNNLTLKIEGERMHIITFPIPLRKSNLPF